MSTFSASDRGSSSDEPREHPTAPRDMPAGDARREAMRQVADDLAEEAEARSAEGGAIDPRALRIENEIAQHFNELSVTGALPGYEYAWINFTHQGGKMVNMKLAHRVVVDGDLVPVWEVVQGDMKEALSQKGLMADTTRRLGDVLLMRAPRDRAMAWRKMMTARQRALEGAPEAALQELSDKYAHLGVKVHTGINFDDPSSTLAKAMSSRAGYRSQLQAMAMQMVDAALRTGSVPGIARPGARRPAG